ncbi:hypothetical protein CROQUDRAFT_693953 [Cronartium quercuum f. sp. fusiforme G11]|uniref:Uncharacterized protein n=1 Tax=Cronartium quercuum f. sp. fusiforme G11 TaxID=708437 RepID=A0A9P6NU18_9BASI|nr:hypothetical protein CROQUDRAFT_693953 [Cronartium quercuum f. sp. fusiforme G11]
MAEWEYGRRVAFCETCNFGYFKGSKVAKDIYNKHGGGARNTAANAELRSVWNNYTQEQKDSFIPANSHLFKLANLMDKTQPYSTSNQLSVEDSSTSSEAVELEPEATTIMTKSDTTILDPQHSKTNGAEPNQFHANTRSLRCVDSKVRAFLRVWGLKANDMSKCFPVDFVIVAVSSHLSNFAFQYIHSTPGLWSWVEQDQTANPLATTAAKMQASWTGVSVGGLQAPALAKPGSEERSKIQASMDKLICATSSPNLFTRASNLLTEPTAKLMNQDFAKGLVLLADIPSHV